jgi:hypothetical protein
MHRGWIWRGARHSQSPMPEAGGDGFTYPQMTARYVHLYTQHGSSFHLSRLPDFRLRLIRIVSKRGATAHQSADRERENKSFCSLGLKIRTEMATSDGGTLGPWEGRVFNFEHATWNFFSGSA